MRFKLFYYFDDYRQNWQPACQCDLAIKEGSSLVSTLFTDDGGIPIAEALPWINVGVARVEAVMSGAVPEDDWAMNWWGARLGPDEVEVYALTQETYFAAVPTRIFYQALVAWRDFIQTPPDSQTVIEIEI